MDGRIFGSMIESSHDLDINLQEELSRIEQEVQLSESNSSCEEDGDSPMKKLSKKSADTGGNKETTGREYSGADLAKELGMKPGALRKALRTIDAKKPGKQWVWPKKSDPDLEKIRTAIKERTKGSKPEVRKLKKGK